MNTTSNIREKGAQTVKFLVVGFAVIFVSISFLYPQVFYCETIGLSDFRKIQRNIFVSPDLNPRTYTHTKNVIRASIARIDSFYMGHQSRPTIIVCSNKDQYKKYCNSTEGAGCSLGTPWGSSYVIVSNQSLNVDVISHEMSHVELLTQLGWWKTLKQIPQWFNEGLALMLDKRFVATEDPVVRYISYRNEWRYYAQKENRILRLNDIESFKDFFTGDDRDIMFAYMSSGMEVSYWMARSGKKGFQEFLHDMRGGEAFQTAYAKGISQNGDSAAVLLPLNPFHIKNRRENKR